MLVLKAIGSLAIGIVLLSQAIRDARIGRTRSFGIVWGKSESPRKFWSWISVITIVGSGSLLIAINAVLSGILGK